MAMNVLYKDEMLFNTHFKTQILELGKDRVKLVRI